MSQEERQQQYEDYIRTVSAAAAAIGRRKPYSMTYIKKHGKITLTSKRQEKEKEENDD